LRLIFRCFTIILFLTLLQSAASAQLITEPDRSGSQHSVFPLIGYTTDYGLFGGGVYQRINYADSRRPFLSNTMIDITGSTKGKWAAHFDYERIEMFGRPIRNRTVVDLELNPIRSYFGIGNRTLYTRDDLNDGLYYLNQQHALVTFEARRAIFGSENGLKLEGALRLKTSYTSAIEDGEETRFVTDPPTHFDAGWVNTLGTGLIFDTRENEFVPTSGQRSEIGIDMSSSIFGSSYSFYEMFADVRSYTSFTENTVLAQRFSARHTIGDTPFWELPSIGSSRGLRGFALDRFMGDSSILYMAELRQWLFSFLEDEIRIGAHIFYDTGRVFSDFDSSELFGEWKQSWGVGGAMTLLSPDLIFRGEIGFSGEDYRIYAGVGYAF